VLIATLRAAGTSLLVDGDCRLERARARRCGDLHGRTRGARSQQDNRLGAGSAHGASRGRAGSTPLSRTSCLINARRLAGARRHFGRQPCGALRGQLPARALHRARRARNPCHSSEAANVEHVRLPRARRRCCHKPGRVAMIVKARGDPEGHREAVALRALRTCSVRCVRAIRMAAMLSPEEASAARFSRRR